MSANPAIENHGELVSLDPLVTLLADDMKAVNAMILQRLASDVPLIPELAGHLPARKLPVAARMLWGWQPPSNSSIRQRFFMMM
jgi:hypothetical protein